MSDRYVCHCGASFRTQAGLIVHQTMAHVTDDRTDWLLLDFLAGRYSDPMDGREAGTPVAGLPLCTPLALTMPPTGRARGGDRARCAGLPASRTVAPARSVLLAPQAAPGVRGRTPRRRSTGRVGQRPARALPVGVRVLAAAALVTFAASAGLALGSLAALTLLLHQPH